MSDAGTPPETAHADTQMAQVVLITAVATIGGFLFGFDSGVINGTVDGLRVEVVLFSCTVFRPC
jgi:SP family sugar:H+ symporter-like MFS transporter